MLHMLWDVNDVYGVDRESKCVLNLKFREKWFGFLEDFEKV